MPRPRVLGVSYGPAAKAVVEGWKAFVSPRDAAKEAQSRLKALVTFEMRARADPFAGGAFVARAKWPRCAELDHGKLPNLARFELPEAWRGIFCVVGEPEGVRVWVLYLWDHSTYDKQFGYRKK